jgi:hypothetical protein
MPHEMAADGAASFAYWCGFEMAGSGLGHDGVAWVRRGSLGQDTGAPLVIVDRYSVLLQNAGRGQLFVGGVHPRRGSQWGFVVLHPDQQPSR